VRATRRHEPFCGDEKPHFATRFRRDATGCAPKRSVLEKKSAKPLTGLSVSANLRPTGWFESYYSGAVAMRCFNASLNITNCGSVVVRRAWWSDASRVVLALVAIGATHAAVVANAQELITNGSFADGLTGWGQTNFGTLGGSFGTNANGPTDTSAASGDYAYAGGATYNLLTQSIGVTTGSSYRLTFLAGSKSGQGSTFGLLSLFDNLAGVYNSASFDYRPTDAVFSTYTVDFVARGATEVWLRNDLGGFAAYDNVSVTPIASVQNAMNYTSASGFSSITSVLSGSGKVTSNAGTGGLTLSGANTYTGGTEITGGTLFVTDAGTLGDAGGSVTLTSGGVGEVVLDLRNQQIRTGTIAMVGQDARIRSGDPNNPGSIVNNGVAFQFGGGLLSVPVSGSAGMNVTGGGVISGSNSYAGPTTISATPGWYGTNTLFVENANALGAASADLTISGNIVSLQNNTVTRSGNLTITGGQVNLGTFSKSGSAYDIQGGQINAVLAGTAGLTKSSGGTASLSGVNSYSGGTQVTDGTLIVTGSGTLGAAGGSVAVSGSGQLDLRNQQVLTGTISMTGQDARILSGDSGNPGSLVNNGGAIQFGGGGLFVPVSGSGGLNVTGGGAIRGSNSYTGPTTISATPGWYGANSLFVENANGLGDAAGDLTISGGIVSLYDNTITRTGNLAITGGIVQTGTFSKSGSAYDIRGGQISVVLTGDAGLTKSGAGVAVLSGNNSYAGATAVDAGGLLVNGAQSGSGLVSVANGGRIGGDGSLAGGLTLADGANLIFNPLTTLDVGGAVTLPNSFGVANLVNADNSSIDWGAIADGTYTLIGTTESTFGNITNFGPGNAYDLGGGRSAYFQNGSLELVVVPEPSSLAMLGCVVACGGLLLRRRRASVAR